LGLDTRVGAQVRIQSATDGKRELRPARLASVVVSRLAHRIVGGELPPGSILPTEGALGEEFGVSRTVVREALKVLEERGLVRVEQGRGTTVQSRDSWALLEAEVLEIALDYDKDLVLLDDLVRVRRLLEEDMARVAATRLSDEDLAWLADNLEQMERAKADWPTFQQLDLSFHRVVMRASGSEVGRAIVSTIHAYGLRRPMFSYPATAATLELTIAQHRGILEALVARDSMLAASRIAAHIESAWADRMDPQRSTARVV
jgi:DNA-binding FadR family transcriptional regulator